MEIKNFQKRTTRITTDFTLISKPLTDYLSLSKQEREIQFSNAVSSTTKTKSKLLIFSMSGGYYPGEINVKSAWIVEYLNLPQNISSFRVK